MKHSTIVAVVVALCVVSFSQAVPVTWTGNAGTNVFNTAGNWTDNTAPAYNVDVLLDNSAPASLVMSTYGNARTLEITRAGDITFTGNFSMSVYNNEKTLWIHPSDHQAHTYTYAGNWSSATGNNNKDPNFVVEDGCTFINQSSWSSAINTYTKSGNGTIKYGSRFIAPALVTVSGGTFQSLPAYGNSYIDNTPTFNIAAGAIVQTDGTPSGNGAPAGSWKKFTINGDGKWIAVKGFSSTAAVFNPGTAGTAGLFTIEGNTKFVLDGTNLCTLNVDITGNGTVAGTDYDQLAITGAITNLSNLKIDINVAGSNVAGKTYTVLTSGSSLSGLSLGGTSVTGTTNAATFGLSADNKAVTVTFAPEPVSMTLLCMGGLGLLRRRR